MLTQEAILSMLARYRENHPQYGIESIGIFGSYARGGAAEASDIDVYVSLEHSSLFLLSRMRIELEELLGVPTDIVQLRDRMNPALKRHIEEDAIRA